MAERELSLPRTRAEEHSLICQIRLSLIMTRDFSFRGSGGFSGFKILNVVL